MTAARVEVDPLLPGREPLLGGHGRHRLAVAGGEAVAVLAGDGEGNLGLSNLAQVWLGAGGAGEGGEVGEAELVVGGGRGLLDVLNARVGRHGDAAPGVAASRELVLLPVMRNS